MNHTIARSAAIAAACAGLALAGCSKSSSHHDGPRSYGVTINSIAGLSDDFIKGADVSMLAQLEASGAKFYDEDGTQKDCLAILKEHGVNWVRLRLWNNPVLAHDFTPESGLTVKAGEAAAGIDDLARDIAVGKRAKALGMKVLLDFHYSDWWADPGKQFVPQAWESMDAEKLKTALYGFTKDTLVQMRAAGAGPDMVQLGNEVTNGMLWPAGRINNTDPSTWDGFVALLGQGSKAVREVDAAIPIMIHIDHGGENALYRRYFSTLLARGVDFDVIGLSYYPGSNGSLADLRDNLVDISQLFGRPVVIAETAYPWTTADADSQPNSWSGASAEKSGPYLPTVQGQATFLHDLMEVVAGVPYDRGLGIFYWEPDWIAVKGAGWYTQGGDSWDNQAMFDGDHKALPSLNVFRAVSEERLTVEAKPVAAAEQLPVATLTGVPAALPTSANVFYDDGSLRPMYVVWDALDASVWDTPGTTDLQGKLPGAPELSVTLKITVSGLADAGFESGSTTGWTVTTDRTTTPPQQLGASKSDVRTGSYAFHWYDGAAFTFTLEQTVAGLEADKTYSFSLWAMGNGDNGGEQLTAYAYCPPSAATPTASTTFALTGWTADPTAWLSTRLTGLPGSAGSCRIGVTSSARAGDWGSLDDFELLAE